MSDFSSNFIAGLVLGAALAIAAPFAAIDLAGGAPRQDRQEVAPVTGTQNVNRAGKSDRLQPPEMRTTRDLDSKKPAQIRPARIPEGCDPAFSPLSSGARHNYSSRCLA